LLGRAGLAGKVLAELERGVKIYGRYRVWLFSDILSWPFWTVFFFLSVLMYSPSLLSSQNHLNTLTWGFFTFIVSSSFMWGATSLATSAQEGILEYVLLTGSGIRVHMLGRLVTSIIDVMVGGPILLLISAVGFGTKLRVAYPHLMAASLLMAATFFYLFGAILAVALVSLRSPWIVINVAQFAIPFSSGAIPVEALPPRVAEALTYSPFFYIIHPIIASATGNFYLEPSTMLLTGTTLCVIAYMLGRLLEGVLLRKALRRGQFTLY